MPVIASGILTPARLMLRHPPPKCELTAPSGGEPDDRVTPTACNASQLGELLGREWGRERAAAPPGTSVAHLFSPTAKAAKETPRDNRNKKARIRNVA